MISRETCAECGATTSPYDAVNVTSESGAYRLLCSCCFNKEMAERAGLCEFEHPRFEPIRLHDADGNAHDFHFRTLLFGDRLSLEAFELENDDESGGFQAQVLGDPEGDPFALLAEIVGKLRRLVSMKHVRSDSAGLQIIDEIVRGRIEWDDVENAHTPCVIVDGKRVNWGDFGAMLLAFEGWQFKLELRDPSDDPT
jgi:hypothetical protein